MNAWRTWGLDQLSHELVNECTAQRVQLWSGIWIQSISVANLQTVVNDAVAQAQQWIHSNAIAGWIIGNEIELRSSCPLAVVFQAVEAIAKGIAALYRKMGKPIPIFTTCISDGREGQLVNAMKAAPTIGFVMINTYGGCCTLGDRLSRCGFSGHYVIGEFGVQGPWESSLKLQGTSLSLEQSSTEKAAFALSAYFSIPSKPRCLGTFLFFGGCKMSPPMPMVEGSPTWFDLFSIEGEPVIDRVLAACLMWNEGSRQIALLHGLDSVDKDSLRALGNPLNMAAYFGRKRLPHTLGLRFSVGVPAQAPVASIPMQALGIGIAGGLRNITGSITGRIRSHLRSDSASHIEVSHCTGVSDGLTVHGGSTSPVVASVLLSSDLDDASGFTVTWSVVHSRSPLTSHHALNPADIQFTWTSDPVSIIKGQLCTCQCDVSTIVRAPSASLFWLVARIRRHGVPGCAVATSPIALI
jgi:hypothetical protein